LKENANDLPFIFAFRSCRRYLKGSGQIKQYNLDRQKLALLCILCVGGRPLLPDRIHHNDVRGEAIVSRVIVEGYVAHFSSIEWVDFVRHVASAEQSVAMQKHLDEGCGKCLKQFEMWCNTVDFAQREVLYQPPTSVVRDAESFIFPLKLALRDVGRVGILQRVFDSINQNVNLGVRGAGLVPRHLVYKSEAIFLDLRLEPKPETGWLVLAGQVVDAQQPESALAEVAVSLLSKSKTLLQTTTDHLGEFHFSTEAAENLQLLLRVKDSSLLARLPEELTEGACI
jgi:hypothetical protein